MKSLLIGLLLALAQIAPAAVYRVGSANLKARVEHPFQVVELTTTQLKAAFTIDLADPRGATLEAILPTAPLLPPSRLGAFLQARLPTEIGFRSQQVETAIYDPNRQPIVGFQLTFRGKLTSGETVSDARVMLSCRPDSPAIICQVKSVVPIVSLGMAVPRMLWVKADRDVLLDGDVFFGPEGNK